MSERTDELVHRVILRLADVPDARGPDLVEWLRDGNPLLEPSVIAGSVERAIARANGYGPISELLTKPDVTEVMINGDGPVWIDCEQGLVKTSIAMTADDVGLLVERILDPLGLRVDRVSPMVDARLPDGSRVNVIVPPLAIDGPIVTIRRFGGRPVELGAFGPVAVVEMLAELVKTRASILVVGGTGTGKTTLLNALGGLIPESERVIVVEDTTELRLPGHHVIRLEARPPNSEGVGEITLRQLVRNALRMRPDRLIVGEVRGGEAFDLLLALNTGHRGSLTTCHANGPDAGLRRLETLSLMAGVGLPLLAIREQIGAAVDVVIHLERDHSGQRRIASVSRVETADIPTCHSLWSRP